jgi:hypothetical protein
VLPSLNQRPCKAPSNKLDHARRSNIAKPTHHLAGSFVPSSLFSRLETPRGLPAFESPVAARAVLESCTHGSHIPSEVTSPRNHHSVSRVPSVRPCLISQHCCRSSAGETRSQRSSGFRAAAEQPLLNRKCPKLHSLQSSFSCFGRHRVHGYPDGSRDPAGTIVGAWKKFIIPAERGIG